MRSLLWIAIVTILAVTACNYTEGQCYYRGEGGGNAGVGVGGAVIAANGAGGFGDVPPEPQDATDGLPPICNIEKDTPCNEKCLEDYIDEAAKCGKMAERAPCDNAAYEHYKSCRGNCTKQEDCKERCKKQCDKIHDRCHEDCNKNDPTSSCRVKCNNEYSQCLRECNDDCK